MPPGGQGPVLGGQSAGLVIPVVIAVVVIVLRNSRARTLKIERMWLFPAIYVGLLATALWDSPPAITPTSVATMLLALSVGAALGWQRGRFTRIEINLETHELKSRASAIGMILILVVMLARQGLRYLLAGNTSALGVPALVISDGLLILAVAMLSVQRLEMWQRASRLLAEARAAKASGLPPGANPPIVS